MKRVEHAKLLRRGKALRRDIEAPVPERDAGTCTSCAHPVVDRSDAVRGGVRNDVRETGKSVNRPFHKCALGRPDRCQRIAVEAEFRELCERHPLDHPDHPRGRILRASTERDVPAVHDVDTCRLDGAFRDGAVDVADAVAHHEAAFRDHYSVADDESVGDDVRRPHVDEVRHRHLAGHVQIAEHLHLACDGSASIRRKVIPDQVSDGVRRKRVQVALEALQDVVRLGAIDLDAVDEVEVAWASDEELLGLVVPRLRHGLLVAELERTPLVHWERVGGLRRLHPHRAERVSVEYAQLRIRLTRRHRLAFVHPPDDLDQVGAVDRRLSEEGGVVGDRRQFEVVRREAGGGQHSQAEGRAVGGAGPADEAVVDRAAAVVRGDPGGAEDVSGRGGGGRPPGSSHAVRLPVEARLHGRFKGTAVALHRGLEQQRLAAVGLELRHLGAGGLDRPAEGDGGGESEE